MEDRSTGNVVIPKMQETNNSSSSAVIQNSLPVTEYFVTLVELFPSHFHSHFLLLNSACRIYQKEQNHYFFYQIDLLKRLFYLQLQFFELSILNLKH